MSIHSATLPLRTFDLRQVCYEGALDRCSLVVGRAATGYRQSR
jgi:hypothetical protein